MKKTALQRLPMAGVLSRIPSHRARGSGELRVAVTCKIEWFERFTLIGSQVARAKSLC
jgi:hypothetical protein